MKTTKTTNVPVATSSKGPVESLESQLKPDWWCSIFNHLYLKTDGDVVEDASITNAESELFSSLLDLEKNSHILDLCCGQGRHSLALARSGYTNIEGFDRSRYLIRRARNSAKGEGLSVKFREGDARRLPHATDSFDAVMILGNSFGYFESAEDDARVIAEVKRILKPDGKLILDICDGDFMRSNFKDRSWEWIDKKYFVCRERSLSSDQDRLISREVITDVNKGVIADQFYAERLYSVEAITRLLTSGGFSSVAVHTEWKPESLRGMDLGMMEQRLIITTEIKKEWTKKRSIPAASKKHVVVILGDPSMEDSLKPNHVFDEDDFHTINKMKEALAQMDDYKYTFLDNHRTLVTDLLKLKDNIHVALNLCDEGFYNDPRKELHVPSLLDMLGIPYTGAGPQCLAFCYDKSVVRGIAGEMGINVPSALLIQPGDTVFDIPASFPLIIKPNFGDSSFGITAKSIVNNGKELMNTVEQIRKQFGYDKTILAEDYLQGKDLTFGSIGSSPGDFTVLPILEEDYSSLPAHLPKICGYEAKWCPDSPYWKLTSIVADLPDETRETITNWSLALAERLECKDYFRIDWRLNSAGVPHLLEVNPNPGWCWDGHLAKMCGKSGFDYHQMIRMIINSAETRLYPAAEDRLQTNKDFQFVHSLVS